MIKNLFLMILTLSFFFGCGGYDSEQLDEPNYIEIQSNSEYVVVGGYIQYSAIGHYDDNRTEDLSNKVYWSNDNTDILTIGENGLAYGKQKGTDKITVSWNNMVKSTKAVEVKKFNRLVFDYPYVVKSVGEGHQSAITIVYEDLDFEKNVNLDMFIWTSSDSSVASVDSFGLVTANSIGSAKITATIGTVSRSMKIVVKDLPLDYIEILTNTDTVLKGLHEQYRAIGYYCDGSHKEITYDVNWTSSNVDIATVEIGGRITALKDGKVSITATYNGVSSSEDLVVNSVPLKLLYINGIIEKITKGYSEAFYVTGIFEDGRSQEMRFDVSWDTDNHHVLEIDSGGNAYGLQVGTANILASLNNIHTKHNIEVVDVALDSIKIIPTYSYIATSFTLPYRVEALFMDGRISYFDYLGVWDILSEDIASIDTSGLVTAHTEGKAIIEFIYDKTITKDVITVTP